jgi:cathepsin L
MARFLLSAASLLVIIGVKCVDAAAPSLDTVDESYTFENFVAEFSKSYSDQEISRRRAIFHKNLRHISEHNRKRDKGYVLGINQFTDFEPREIPRGYDKSFHASWNGGAGVVASGTDELSIHQLELPFNIDQVSDLPKSVDWRNHGVVTPVKCQVRLGKCCFLSEICTFYLLTLSCFRAFVAHVGHLHRRRFSNHTLLSRLVYCTH